MAAFTVSNVRPALVDVHPPVIFRAIGPQAGKASGGGAFRAVRCTLTGPTTYDVGGSLLPALPGIKRIEALLVVAGDDAAQNHDGLALRLVTATDVNRVRIMLATNAESTAVSQAASSWEVLILGR